jgi:hypothetical protein
MTFEILWFYQKYGLSEFRKEDVGLMGRWSAAAQALRSASGVVTQSDLEQLRKGLGITTGESEDEDDPDVQPGG